MHYTIVIIHSSVRWLLAVVAVAALVRVVVGVAGKQSYDRLAQGLMTALAMLASLQWLIGIVLLIVSARFGDARIWIHAAIMTVAVGATHMHRRWRGATDSVRYGASLGLITAFLLLVVIGVAIVQGWSFGAYSGK